MTITLQDRLRSIRGSFVIPVESPNIFAWAEEAADALDAKDAEIERLQFRLECEATEARKKIHNLEMSTENGQALRAALEEIATSKYCQYEHSGSGRYGIGVADGHRWCAQVAKDALDKGRDGDGSGSGSGSGSGYGSGDGDKEAEIAELIKDNAWATREIQKKNAEIERLQGMIDSAIQSACETQPSWEWRCVSMGNALGCDFPLPKRHYEESQYMQPVIDAARFVCNEPENRDFNIAILADKLDTYDATQTSINHES